MARIFEDQEQWDQAKLTYSKVIELNTVELKFAQERIDWIQQNIYAN